MSSCFKEFAKLWSLNSCLFSFSFSWFSFSWFHAPWWCQAEDSIVFTSVLLNLEGLEACLFRSPNLLFLVFHMSRKGQDSSVTFSPWRFLKSIHCSSAWKDSKAMNVKYISGSLAYTTSFAALMIEVSFSSPMGMTCFHLRYSYAPNRIPEEAIVYNIGLILMPLHSIN